MSLPELRLQVHSYTMAYWVSRDDGQELFDLDAPYQRGAVWTQEQQRNLIKSLYMGLPVGSIVVSYLGDRLDRPFRVVDGKQRVLAVRAWHTNQLAVPAEWFRPGDLADDNNYDRADVMVKWNDLSQACHRRFIMATQLPSLEFHGQTELTRRDKGYDRRDRTPQEVVQAEAELYLLINFAGVTQTDTDRSRAETVARPAT
jgi:hypothetical protein